MLNPVPGINHMGVRDHHTNSCTWYRKARNTGAVLLCCVLLSAGVRGLSIHDCEGISPLGYWQKVYQSPTQTKPYNTPPV